MYTYEDIRTIHLEVTQNCQAACPMCDRNCNGKGVNPHIKLDELTLEDCKRIFSPMFIKQLDTMYMCGNLGDPIVATFKGDDFESLNLDKQVVLQEVLMNANLEDMMNPKTIKLEENTKVL